MGGDYRYIYLDSTDMGIKDQHDGGIYLTLEYQPHKKFLIIPSIKGVFNGNSAVPVPKLGFVWNPVDSFSLKNNYFRSFKFPDFEDLYWFDGENIGNPDLEPEDGWGADLGADWQVTKNFGLESSIYGQWTRDSIHWYSSTGSWRPENVGEAAFFGLDSKARYTIPLSRGPFEKIGLSLSYHYMLSYLLSYGYTWDSDKRIPYMPAHTVGASVDIPWKTGSLLISGHFESTRYADSVNLTEMDPYFLLNFTVNQEIGANLTAFGVVRNALNTSYESMSGNPIPGITVTLGVKADFEIPGKKDSDSHKEGKL
jgi:vitamin B12 transporter